MVLNVLILSISLSRWRTLPEPPPCAKHADHRDAIKLCGMRFVGRATAHSIHANITSKRDGHSGGCRNNDRRRFIRRSRAAVLL